MDDDDASMTYLSTVRCYSNHCIYSASCVEMSQGSWTRCWFMKSTTWCLFLSDQGGPSSCVLWCSWKKEVAIWKRCYFARLYISVLWFDMIIARDAYRSYESLQPVYLTFTPAALREWAMKTFTPTHHSSPSSIHSSSRYLIVPPSEP